MLSTPCKLFDTNAKFHIIFVKWCLILKRFGWKLRAMPFKNRHWTIFYNLISIFGVSCAISNKQKHMGRERIKWQGICQTKRKCEESKQEENKNKKYINRNEVECHELLYVQNWLRWHKERDGWKWCAIQTWWLDWLSRWTFTWNIQIYMYTNIRRALVDVWIVILQTNIAKSSEKPKCAFNCN